MALIGLSNPITFAQFHARGGTKNHLLTSMAVLLIGATVMYVTVKLAHERNAVRVLDTWATGLLIGQSAVIVLLGSSRVATAIRKDITTEVMESHRLMPVSGAEVFVGYLVGAALQVALMATGLFLLGGIAAGASGVPLDRWVMSNVILAIFGVFMWVIIGASAFLVRGTLAWVWPLIGVASVAKNIPGGAESVPALGVLLTPMQGQTVFSFRASTTTIPIAVAVSVATQVLIGATFFAAAVRKYRRPHEPAMATGLGIALLCAWVLVSAIGMGFDDMFSLGRPGGWNDVPPYVQAIASTVVGILLSVAALSGAGWAWVTWHRARRAGDPTPWRFRPLHPMIVTLLVAVVLSSLLLFTFEQEDQTQRVGRGILTVVVLLAYSAGTMLVGWAMHAKRRGAGWLLGLWVLGMAIIPMVAELIYVNLMDPLDVHPDEMGVFSAGSPVGAIIMLQIQDRPNVLPGVLFQMVMVGLVWALTRKARLSGSATSG